MASCVNVLCPNGHRVSVKVTPTTSVLHIVEEVCKKKGFDPDKFAVKSEAGKIPIDVTLQLRYANLPNNAKLELIPAAVPRSVGGGGVGGGATVSISLQLPDGARLKPLDFPVDASLLKVVEDFEKQEAGGGESLVKRGMEPVVVYMRDQFCGSTRLKATSLKSIGLISGRGLLRLNQRKKSADDDDDATPATDAPVPMDEDDESKTGTTAPTSGAAPTGAPTAAPAGAPAAAPDPLVGMKLSADQIKIIESISEGYRDYQRESGQLDSAATAAASSNTAAAASSSSFPVFPAPNRDFLPETARPPPSASSSSKKTSPPPPVAVVRPQMEFADFKFPEKIGGGGGVEEEEEDSSLADSSAEPCEREMKVFNLDLIKEKSSTENGSSAMEVDDDFFELTVDDIRSRLTELQKSASDDAPLLTSAMRQRQQEAKFANYQRTLVRVHFPDRTVLQGMFRLREPVGALYHFVLANLSSSSSSSAASSFSLYVTPPRQDLVERRATMMEAGLAPAANVYFGADGKWTTGKFLSEDCLQKLADGADLRGDLSRTGRQSGSESNREDESASGETGESRATSSAKRQTNDKGKTAGAAGGKMPKWFAAGKKK